VGLPPSIAYTFNGGDHGCYPILVPKLGLETRKNQDSQLKSAQCATKKEKLMDIDVWAKALDILRAYTFKIATPNGSGTGFLIKCGNINNIFGIATAYHVISHSYLWEGPIKLIHEASGKQVILRNPEDRFIYCNQMKDIAIIMFVNNELELPKEELNLVAEDKHIKPGITIGWVGYPAVAPDNFSFFSGAVSCFLNDRLAYLVDGVAINGVSGGPAFIVGKEIPHIMGVVSAYIPNRATGESLPGVCFVVGIHPFYEFIKDIKSVEEAQEKAKKIDNEPPTLLEDGSIGDPTAAK
jgi:hypothetical protein